MAYIVQQNKNITKLLQTTYSDNAIISYFTNNFNLKFQLSITYYNDPIKQKIILQNIISQHLKFRDALVDPLQNNSIKIIKEHYEYFWDPSLSENSQLRGPQTHLSHQMYSAFGFAGNGIQHSGLSGASFGNSIKVIKPATAVYLPSSTLTPSPHSFRQGYECGGATIISSVFQKDVYVSDDNINNFPVKTIHMLKDMPKAQKIGDFGIVHRIDSNRVIYSQTDAKFQNEMLAKSDPEPRQVFVGSMDLPSELQLIRDQARDILHGNLSRVSHVDPKRNNIIDKYDIMKKIERDGLIEDGADILGIPKFYTNRHNE